MDRSQNRELRLEFFDFLKSKRALILNCFAAAFLFSQFMSTASFLAKNAETRAIVSARDDDAGNVIAKAMDTRLYNSNDWFPYGPVYYRVAHVLEYFGDAAPSTSIDSPKEIEQRSLHFVLMWVSLASVFLFCFFLASLISSQLYLRFILTSLFVSGLLDNFAWCSFIIRAHPDMLVILLLVLSSFLTYKYMTNTQSKLYFTSSAVLWGITASTKLIFLFFVPPIIFVMIWPFSKQNLKITFNYLLWILASYFVIGCPQNFIFWEPIKFLIYQTAYSEHASTASFFRWVGLFEGQTIYAFLVLLVTYPIFNERTSSPKPGDFKVWLKWTTLFLFPFFVLLSKEMLSHPIYYTLPLVPLFLMNLVLGFQFIPYNNKLTTKPWFFVLAFGFLFIGKWTHLTNPNQMTIALNDRLECRDDARTVDTLVKGYTLKSKLVYVDPYVPTPDDRTYINSSWAATMKDIKPGKTDALIFKKWFYDRFLTGEKPEPGIMVDTPDWKATRQFYKTFDGKTDAVDAYGQKWHKVHQDDCTWQIWEREKD